MASTNSHLAFQVKRSIPELVVPEKATPHEVKKLSDIDDQESLRFLIPVIWFYRNNSSNNPSMEGKDPVKVIREALGKALVYYYPLAGRLIEDRNKKLVVDCNGQGVLFIEANADVTFDQLGHTIQPPSPFLNEFLHNVPGSDGILGCPLILIQVTRLLCGGFILALRLNHTMCDAFGLYQFMNTLAEMAKGAQHPTIPPVWKRELLNARNPPRITRIHYEYPHETTDDHQQLHDGLDQTNMVQFPLFLNSNQIRGIRSHLPSHLRSACSRYELLTACLWRCRTLALNLDPEEVVQISGLVNGRGKKSNKGLNLPVGYYGNAFAYPSAVSKAGVLCKNPLGYAVELVKKAKSEVDEEYLRSVADLMVIRGRPPFKITKGHLVVSDVTGAALDKIDFGWGLPEHAGPATGFTLISFFMKYKVGGEDGVVMPICLPLFAVDRFRQEVKKITTEAPDMYEITEAHLVRLTSRF
ncbi:alcohol acyl transferase 1 allele RGb-like [Ziziphus jujuba]|uniref:Alcohol acyl transferase 1 allele RGb-like n=1 Tax=Ziziphus jujuba TaxID=326968 RepID=A0ABM3I2U4_ZIZJJ|nr:alcohol acyl transferase 1 allele RGb-like [Ziziphus jujuba]